MQTNPMDTPIPLTLREKVQLMVSEIGSVAKAGRNDFQRYDYTKAEDLIRHVQKARARYDVAFSFAFETLRDELVESDKGKSSRLVAVKCRLTISDSSDAALVVEALGAGSDTGNDKAYMKAMTAAHKYALALAFSIPFGADPEATTDDGKPTAVASSKAPEHGIDEVKLAIAAAGTVKALEKIREHVVARRGTSDYDGLVQAYQSREKELSK